MTVVDVLRIVATALGVSVACAPSSPEARGTGPGHDELALGALGYVAFSVEAADPQKRGVVRHVPSRSAAGVNLVSNATLCSADLFDASGVVVNHWRAPDRCRHWAAVHLLPGGELLAVSLRHRRVGGYEPGAALLRLSWDGKVIQELQMPIHHAIEVRDDGRILLLGRKSWHPPGCQEMIDDNLILVVDPDGEVLEEQSLYELLSIVPGGLADVELAATPNRGLDLLHANSLHWVRFPRPGHRPPGWGNESLMVTMRHQHRVVVFDWQTKELVWVFGDGVLDGPHDASLLPNGHVLVFDNGWRRGWSRVVEIDPSTGRIVWRYPVSQPDALFTESRGGAQLLSNGNLLLSVSDRGQTLEITPTGEVVWEWLNPHQRGGRRSSIGRMRRYPEALVSGLRDRTADRARP